MSVYTTGHISSRTAGFIPGVTAPTSQQNLTRGARTSPPSPNAAPALTPDTASPHNAVSQFDALLQNENSASTLPPAGTPPSATMQENTFQQGRHNTQQNFKDQDTFRAALHSPSPQDAAREHPHANSRTAGRAVHGNESTGFTSDKTDSDFSFFDFLDIINPLQHIPIISSAYRAITGDEIKAPARVLGGAIFGGPVGAAFGVANAISEDVNGGDIGESVMAMVGGKKHPPIQTAVQKTAFDGGNYKAAAIQKTDIVWNTPPKPQQNNTNIRNLPGSDPTHIHPTHGFSADHRPHASHSKSSDAMMAKTAGAEPPLSTASQEGERIRSELSNAGQKNAGSPLTPVSQAVQMNAAGSATSSEPNASSYHQADMHMMMMQALDKYEAMKKL